MIMAVILKRTAPSLNVNVTGKDESERIIVHENLLQRCSKEEDKSKQRIINKTLLWNYSADVDELCSTEIHISEHTITEQKYEEYEESSVTK